MLEAGMPCERLSSEVDEAESTWSVSTFSELTQAKAMNEEKRKWRVRDPCATRHNVSEPR